MTGLLQAQETSSAISLSGSNLSYVVVVALVAIAALVMAGLFRREVLAAGEGTERMQAISLAVQEGAAAYLYRQFRTLAIFVVLVVGLLFLLPGAGEVRFGRSLFFVIGAVFSGAIGYFGMSLAVRANVRVAAAARDEGRDPAMRIAFRTGGVVGWPPSVSVCSAQRPSCSSTRVTHRQSSKASASVLRFLPCSCG